MKKTKNVRTVKLVSSTMETPPPVKVLSAGHVRRPKPVAAMKTKEAA
jgi:hypothetical protein